MPRKFGLVLSNLSAKYYKKPKYKFILRAAESWWPAEYKQHMPRPMKDYLAIYKQSNWTSRNYLEMYTQKKSGIVLSNFFAKPYTSLSNANSHSGQ